MDVWRGAAVFEKVEQISEKEEGDGRYAAVRTWSVHAAVGYGPVGGCGNEPADGVGLAMAQATVSKTLPSAPQIGHFSGAEPSSI